jgi:hypothetical protein
MQALKDNGWVKAKYLSKTHGAFILDQGLKGFQNGHRSVPLPVHMERAFDRVDPVFGQSA